MKQQIKKASFLQLIKDSYSLLTQLFDKLPDHYKNSPYMKPLNKSQDVWNSFQLEMNYIILLSFIDVANDVFNHYSWKTAFNSVITQEICKYSGKKYCKGDIKYSWKLFSERLDRFNRSSDKIGQRWSDWSGEYTKNVIEKFKSEFNDDDYFSLYVFVREYYGDARTTKYKLFYDFLSKFEVVLDENDVQLISKVKKN